MTHKFEPRHIDKLLREDRLGNVSPEALLKDAGLKEGDAFADIGCGPGYFTLPASAAVGPSGKVYAVDTQEEMLAHLKKRNPPPNVIPVKSGENSIPLDDATVDFAFIAYVLHETEKKDLFLKEIKRIMRDSAVVLIIDWKKKKEEHGPPKEERLTQGAVVNLLKGAGFVSIKASSLNRSHYRITALKKG